MCSIGNKVAQKCANGSDGILSKIYKFHFNLKTNEVISYKEQLFKRDNKVKARMLIHLWGFGRVVHTEFYPKVENISDKPLDSKKKLSKK